MKRAGISADSLRTRLSAGCRRICMASKSSTPLRSITISPSSADCGGRRFASGLAAPGSSGGNGRAFRVQSRARRGLSRGRRETRPISARTATRPLRELANELRLHRWEGDRAVEIGRPLDGLAARPAIARTAMAEPTLPSRATPGWCLMRRVAVTGLGAVTPVGSTARETWDAAVAGRSGIDFIRSFDATGYPVRIAAEVKDFDPGSVVPVKEARRSTGTRCSGWRPPGKRSTTPASTESTTRCASASSSAQRSAASLRS